MKARQTMKNDEGKKFRHEVIITGFGGQGVVLAGRILGEAAVVGDHRESTFIQSYGPEARGGECSAQVIISSKSIHYPYVRHPDVLVCMSQGGYDKYIGELQEEGILMIEEDLVKSGGFKGSNLFAIPATRMAEEMGRAMMANIIMLGFFTAITGTVSFEAIRAAVRGAVPKGTEEMNIQAFNKGHEFGMATIKSRQKKAAGKAGVAG
jgi:2-oxoglutarate ferredoxin oxidoreductase subunit gamma